MKALFKGFPLVCCSSVSVKWFKSYWRKKIEIWYFINCSDRITRPVILTGPSPCLLCFSIVCVLLLQRTYKTITCIFIKTGHLKSWLRRNKWTCITNIFLMTLVMKPLSSWKKSSTIYHVRSLSRNWHQA